MGKKHKKNKDSKKNDMVIPPVGRGSVPFPRMQHDDLDIGEMIRSLDEALERSDAELMRERAEAKPTDITKTPEWIRMMEENGIVCGEKQPSAERLCIFTPPSPSQRTTAVTDTNRRRDAIISKLPRYIEIPDISDDKSFLLRARAVWQTRLQGLDDICERLLQHVVEFRRTQHTRPVCFVGEAGCGKTTAAEAYAAMLMTPFCYINAPRTACSRGLFGESGSYQDGCVGEVIEAMVTSGRGDTLLFIDEIDKAVTKQSGKTVTNIQDQALNLLDDTARNFRDNFLQAPVDVSHCPVVLAANDIRSISAPLLDRCDVIRFPSLTKDAIRDIISGKFIPKHIHRMSLTDEVELDDAVVEEFVEELYSRGARSIRVYQSVAENLIGAALTRSIITGERQRILRADIETQIKNAFVSTHRSIGI